MGNDFSEILKQNMPKLDLYKNLNSSTFEPVDIDLLDIEPIPPELSKERIDYEETVLKDFANEIKAVQLETNRQLALLIEESRKSDIISRRFFIATLIVAILTLLATIVGLYV